MTNDQYLNALREQTLAYLNGLGLIQMALTEDDDSLDALMTQQETLLRSIKEALSNATI